MKHVIILWERARRCESQVLDALRSQLTLEQVLTVEWSSEFACDNYRRLLGKSLTSGLDMARSVGTGPFLVVVCSGERPNETNGDSVHSLLRGLLGGLGHNQFHVASDNTDAERLLGLLLGPQSRDGERATSWDGVTRRVKRDVSGARGWASFRELFDILGEATEYVILRNAEEMAQWPDVGDYFDVDVLCRNRESFAAAINGRRKTWAGFDPAHVAIIGGVPVRFDIREVGDDYYCRQWENDMLASRVASDPAFVLSETDQFFALLYHAMFHKAEFPAKYIRGLARAARKFDAQPLADAADAGKEWWNEPRLLADTIAAFLEKRGYSATFPKDLDNGLRFDVVRGLPSRIRPSIWRHRVTKKFRRRLSGYMGTWSRLRYQLKSRSELSRLAKTADRNSDGLIGSVFSGAPQTTPDTLTVWSDKPFELGVPSTNHQPVAEGALPSRINGESCRVFRTEPCASHVIYVRPARTLREAKGLKDGDKVLLELPPGQVKPLSWTAWWIWAWEWKFREHVAADAGRYQRRMRRRTARGETA